MRGINHILEQYKNELLASIASGRLLLSDDMYRIQKGKYCVTKNQVDKAINQLVAEGRVVVKRVSGILFVAFADALDKVSK